MHGGALIHAAGVRRCFAFADAIGETLPEYRDWAVTALFYATVHYLRAYLASVKQVTVSAHQDMHWIWPKYPELRQVKPLYEHLKQQSQKARYYEVTSGGPAQNPWEFSPKDLADLRSSADRVGKILFNKLPPEIREALDGTEKAAHP